MALSPDETTLLLESLAYRMMALQAVASNHSSRCTAARKEEALVVVMGLPKRSIEQSRADG